MPFFFFSLNNCCDYSWCPHWCFWKNTNYFPVLRNLFVYIEFFFNLLKHIYIKLVSFKNYSKNMGSSLLFQPLIWIRFNIPGIKTRLSRGLLNKHSCPSWYLKGQTALRHLHLILFLRNSLRRLNLLDKNIPSPFFTYLK